MKCLQWLIAWVTIPVVLMIQTASADSLIQVSQAMVNEAPPTVTVQAAYLDIANNSDQAITLTNVNSPLFTRIEFHATRLKDGVASMIRQDEINIPANSIFSFSPGDYHLMLFNPTRPLKQGDQVPLQLEFSDGTSISVEAMVVKPGTEHHHH